MKLLQRTKNLQVLSDCFDLISSIHVPFVHFTNNVLSSDTISVPLLAAGGPQQKGQTIPPMRRMNAVGCFGRFIAFLAA